MNPTSYKQQIFVALIAIIALGSGLSVATWSVAEAGKVAVAAGLLQQPEPLVASAPETTSVNRANCESATRTVILLKG